jgi:hypothetical protein
MVSIFSSLWPGSLNQLKDELLNQRIKVSAMFDPEGTGTIKIDDLFLVVLLNALPDKHFFYSKDKIFAENTANNIPDFFKTLETTTNFDNYKTTLSNDPTTSTTPAGHTALAAVTPSTSTSICVMCHKPFPTIISRESQKPFSYCYAYNKKRCDSPDGTTTANPAARSPPIPSAARPPRQKQIQLVHAVLLAAKAADPIVATPAAVAPPSYDTVYFNYDSMNHLSATTLSTDPSSLLSYMDSAASLHCTFDLLCTSSTLSCSPNLFRSVALTS